MADGLFSHVLAVALKYLVYPSTDAPRDPFATPFTDVAPPSAITDDKPSVWNWTHYVTSSAASSKPVVVIGQHSPALITLVELADQYSPELLLILMFCGVVGTATLILYFIFKILTTAFHAVRRHLFGYDTRHQADLSQLSDAARQVYALVQLQNPGLFAQSPVPINTPRRNRTQNNRRR